MDGELSTEDAISGAPHLGGIHFEAERADIGLDGAAVVRGVRMFGTETHGAGGKLERNAQVRLDLAAKDVRYTPGQSGRVTSTSPSSSTLQIMVTG